MPASTPSPAPALPIVFGVLNATPDSFSDGGRHLEPAAALAHGLRLAAEGAAVVDVGGESTRPGARPVPLDEELRRVLPVVEGLVAQGVAVSVDTRHAEVARRAVAVGATTVNDVDGGTGDPAMLDTVAAAGVDYVVMHSRGPAAAAGGYDHVVLDVIADLRSRVRAAERAGVRHDRVIVDPGLGFAKDAEQNWALLAHIDAVAAAFPDLRMLVGASRKRFLGELAPAGSAAEARDGVTAVLSALLAERGAWAVRVHDVAATRAALAVVGRMRAAA